MSERLTESPAWRALAKHFADVRDLTILSLFSDEKRFERFSRRHEDLLVDFPKHRIESETLELWLALGGQANVEGWRDRVFAGERLDDRENGPVLHVAIRAISKRHVQN